MPNKQGGKRQRMRKARWREKQDKIKARNLTIKSDADLIGNLARTDIHTNGASHLGKLKAKSHHGYVGNGLNQRYEYNNSYKPDHQRTFKRFSNK